MKVTKENVNIEKIVSGKGITLVALVITIVIIIILSTIAFNFTFGENGLITKAQQAAEMTQISQIQEQLEMAKGSAFIDGAGEIDPDHYFDIIEDEGIIDDKDTDVEDNEDGSYDITTDGDYVFEVIPKPDGDMDIEYVGKNDEPRISSINVTDKTDSSVTVEVVTKNVDNAEYTYSYKKTEDSSWTDATTGNSDNTYTFSGLEGDGTSYDIKVKVTTSDGKTIEKTITVQVGETVPPVVEVPDGTITFGQVAWQGDGTANMPISTTELGYTLQYQVGSTVGQWATITSGQSITGLRHGNTVYARLTDGTDTNTSEVQQTTIQDKIPPVVSVSSDENTSSSIAVKVQVADNQSGMSDTVTYTYYIKQSIQGDDNYQAPSGASNISESTYTFTNLTQGVSYDIKVEVKSDRAGNTGTGTLLNQTTGSIPGGDSALGDGSITVSEPEWKDGKATITVDTNTDFDIEYQVGDDGEWIEVGEDGKIPDLNPGDKVNIHLTDGENDGEDITITIEDKIPPTVSVTSTGNTSNSVSVSVEASDNESGMASSLTYTYYIKQSSQNDDSYVAQATDISQNTYTFTGLTQGTSYDVKVDVKSDKASNTGTGTLLNQTTASIPGGEGIVGNQITVGETVWADGKASITVNTSSGYSIEYQVNGTSEGSWTNIGNSGTVPNLNYGDTVNISLTDGNNHGDFVTVTIGDDINPTVNVSLGTSTSSSISVNVNTTDAESGMSSNPVYTYYIKESAEAESEYEVPDGATDISSNTYTFANLTQSTSYDIKVEVKADIAGNMGTGTLLNQTTSTIPSGEGETEQGITFGAPIWKDGKASITVSTEETEYSIEYKLSEPDVDTGWEEIENNGTIPNLGHGSIVYARLTDGNNHGDYATTTIQDETNPVVDVKLNGLTTSNSIPVTVKATDTESGMTVSPTYTYYIKQSSETDTAYQTQAGSTNLTSNTYTFTGLTQGTSYDIKVEVTGDMAGNTGTGYLAGQTTQNVPDASGPDIQEGAITFSTASWSNNKASITVSTNTTYQIQYQVGAITEDNWIGIASGGTISHLDYGDMVYARLTDGVNHGEYASASINDGILPQAANIDLSETNTDTDGSVTATVTLADNESGVDITGSKWIYNTVSGNIGLDEGSYTNSFTENPETLKLSENTAGTYYLHVLTKDIAGNKVETISGAVTVKEVVPSTTEEAKPTDGQDGPTFATTTPITDATGINTVVIPGGFHLDADSGTSVEEGIVIEDSDGNQFVWIPTGTYQTSTGAKTNNLSRRTFTSSGTTEVNADDSIKDVSSYLYYGEGDNRSVAYNQIKAFKDSVDKNSGFYIGRYEQGIGNVCKSGLAPYINITRDTAKSQAEAMYSGNSYVVSELISSYAWDTALNFICQTNSEGYVLATTTDETYGNILASGSMKNTGEYEVDNYSNIHDLLGNCYEWTTEYHDVSYAACTGRGGVFNTDDKWAASRIDLSPSMRYSTVSFRVQLYIKM